MDVVIVEVPTVELTVTVEEVVVEIAQLGAQGIRGADGLVPIFSRQNELSIVTGLTRFYFEQSGTISKIRASVGTPATGSSIDVGVYLNGGLIDTVSIPATQNTVVSSLSEPVVLGDYVTVSILAVGSTTAGTDLTVILTVD